MRKDYLTPRTKPVEKLPIEGTSFCMAVPPSIAKHETFSIGPVRFKFTKCKRKLEALDPIPASWFVDISGDPDADLV